MTTPAQFLNLDVVLKSSANLSGLTGYLKGKILILNKKEYHNEYILAFELSSQKENPQEYTDAFISLINHFPTEIMDIWNACTSRVFDYGYYGGAHSPALSTTIGADLLGQMASLRIDARVTVYPFNEP